ncbi:MAG TPA: MFS transporter [Actinoplanes sp.]|nr:MFS transporter [Actinoplanes sp.]
MTTTTVSGTRARVVRWQAGNGLAGVPQAAAPIAFALIALPITGSAESGAVLVLAMTAAQIAGAVPMSRLGARFDGVRFLRTLIAIRTAALLAVTGLAAAGVPFPLLVAAAAAAGSVNGAAHGYQRMLLTHLVPPDRLPRALGVAATLNELTFAASPVLASVLGAVSPVAATAVITVLGAGPMVLMPRVPIPPPEPRAADRRAIPREAYLWLFCSLACAGSVAAVEVGAVSFALSFGMTPGLAFVFALVLCAGSVSGGIGVSVRNRMPANRTIVVLLAVATAAATLILAGGHLATTLAGAAVLGFLLPQFGTFYSLSLDRLAPPGRRAEVFALQRTAGSLGVITISALLATAGLRAALIGGVALLGAALLLAARHTRAR